MTFPLNNGRLHEAPLSSEEYNKLPHISSMADAAAKNAKAHAILLGIIAAHGLADKFSVHLVHKHFDAPEGRVMVYETVQGNSHGDFILFSPRTPQKTPNMRGLYFKAAKDGIMIAYEFTTDPGIDLSAHEDFVAQFATAVLELGVQDIFALTALSVAPKGQVFSEFELGQVGSTVLVANADWLPAQDAETATDWLATADYAKYAPGSVPGIIQLKCIQGRGGTHQTVQDDAAYADGSVPGIIQLKCTKTQSQKHYNFTCSKTRNGTHLGHAPHPFAGQPPQDPQDHGYKINGEVLQVGSEGHNIISHALQMISVA